MVSEPEPHLFYLNYPRLELFMQPETIRLHAIITANPTRVQISILCRKKPLRVHPQAENLALAVHQRPDPQQCGSLRRENAVQQNRRYSGFPEVYSTGKKRDR